MNKSMIPALLACALVAACGQTGPLMLPDEAAMPTPTPVPSPVRVTPPDSPVAPTPVAGQPAAEEP